MASSSSADRENAARLVLVITMLLVLGMALRSPVDSDLFWHLRAGESTLANGRPLLEDPFSFTRAGEPWHNHSWLGQVVLALVYRLGGFPALSWLVALISTGSLLLVYRVMDAPPLVRAFATALAATVAAPVWVARPQIFSLLLFALTLLWLRRYLRGERVWMWLLLPLFVLWSNLHAGYTLGVLLIGCGVAGAALMHLLAPEQAPLGWRKIGALAGWGVACFAAAGINPNGVQTWLVPFQTVGVVALQDFIAEWASPDFHDISQQPLAVMLIGTLATMGLRRERAPLTDFVMVGFFGWMALVARRNFGPFALAAAIPLAEALSELLDDVKNRFFVPKMQTETAYSQFAPRIQGLKKAINLSLVAIIWFAVLWKGIFASHLVVTGVQIASAYPAGAVKYLRSARPPGNLLNAYNWGGYLIWALPEYPVYVDGRTDLFGDEILKEWMSVVQGEGDWQSVLTVRGVRLILLEPERPLVKLLPRYGFTLLDSGEGYVLYGR